MTYHPHFETPKQAQAKQAQEELAKFLALVALQNAALAGKRVLEAR